MNGGQRLRDREWMLRDREWRLRDRRNRGQMLREKLRDREYKNLRIGYLRWRRKNASANRAGRH